MFDERKATIHMRVLLGVLAASAMVIGTASTASAAEPPADVVLQVRNVYSHNCADVEKFSLDDGARVHQWRCFANDNDNQRWTLKEAGDDYKLVNKNSGKCLDVYDRSLDNGMQSIQYTCRPDADPSQRWHLQDLGNDTYKLINRNSGKCLDIAGPTTGNGGYMHQWDCISHATNQQWVLDPVD